MPDLITWVDPTGVEYPLDGSWHGVMANLGITGRFGAPFNYLEQMLPLEHGSQVTNVTVGAAEISLPWDVRAATEADLRDWFDEASWAFNPLRGKGKLRSTRGDGSGIVREFPCYLKSGFESVEESFGLHVAHAPKGLWVFRGGPFWESTTPVTVVFDTSSPAGTWLPVTFPWPFADSSVFGQGPITNPGPVEAWPTIYVRGPGSGFRIENNTTGEYLAIAQTIADGDAIQIETKTVGRKRIFLESSGADLMGFTTGAMFPFAPGANQVTVELGGASIDSLVQVEFNPRGFNP